MKIRTDFVTNSSSSSFVLAVRITLKNGKVLRHMVEGDPEGGWYSEVTATMSPQDIAQSASIEELIHKLETSVTGFDEPSGMISKLKKLSSVDEIARITINGDKYGHGEQHQYAHYTYHMDSGVTAYDHGGDQYIYDEGSGGEIKFFTSGVPGKHFGEATAHDGYSHEWGSPVFDRDVELDPEAMEKEQIRLTQLKTTYAEKRKEYHNIVQALPKAHKDDIAFSGHYFYGSSLPSEIHMFAGKVSEHGHLSDFWVIDFDFPDENMITLWDLERHLHRLREESEVLKNFLMTNTSRRTRFINLKELSQLVDEDRMNGYLIVRKEIEAWKKTIPFDHVAKVECTNRNFAFVGMPGSSALDCVVASKKGTRRNLTSSEWIKRKNGTILPRVTLKCDYLIVGLYTWAQTNAIETAIRYRDSGKSHIKILPEDEFLRIMNGEVLEISEEDQLAMQAREEAARQADELRQQAANRKPASQDDNKSSNSENKYIEAIEHLQKTLGLVRAVDIANHLGVSKPSVSVALKKLREKGIVTVQSDGALTLSIAHRLMADSSSMSQHEAKLAQAAQDKALADMQQKCREAKHEAFLQRQEAEQAAREEAQRQKAEERAMKLAADVLYRPGKEPPALRNQIANLFEKLDSAYPGKQISSLQAEHKKWSEKANEIRKLLGYPDSQAFLEAYGYTMVNSKGGRPSTVDPEKIIGELKKRYPNGGCKNVAQLKKENSDLPIKTLVNNAQKLFGMSLGDYLKEIGVLL